jgi:hypothetical protein
MFCVGQLTLDRYRVVPVRMGLQCYWHSVPAVGREQSEGLVGREEAEFVEFVIVETDLGRFDA